MNGHAKGDPFTRPTPGLWWQDDARLIRDDANAFRCKEGVRLLGLQITQSKLVQRLRIP